MGSILSLRDHPPGQARTIAQWLQAADAELAAAAVAARVEGLCYDLTAPLPTADQVEVLTFADEEGREIYWHSTSHLMAQATKQLFPQTKLAIGPAIAEGFYYDFDTPVAFGPEDLDRVAERMRELIAQDLPVERLEVDRAEAMESFGQAGEPYKVELLSEIQEPVVTLYRQGEFVDLCRGPHLPSTGRIGAFRLLSVSGAYWRGDERRPMLQRIYGVSFPTQQELEEHVQRLEEAARRDHRKLGRELDLFSIPESAGGGLVLWHPKGGRIRQTIEDFWRAEHRKRGYELVFTPHIAREDLWQTSGHLTHFREDMYSAIEVDQEKYLLKPMNCPFHIMIYQSRPRSYRELPLRYAELGTVYRYERSGVLRGLLRVRGFTQDDAHIFCTPEQVPQEISAWLDLARYMIQVFGYQDWAVDLSLRQEGKKKYLGEDADWAQAEAALVAALDRAGIKYKRAPGEAKFYGPAIDIKLRDCVGNLWQGPVLQYDFNLPERFAVTYVGPDGQEHPVVMLHRTAIGSMERFIAGLVEHYNGAFPLWLAPVQVVVIPITDRHHDYARQVLTALEEEGLRAEADLRSESTRFKIREAQLQKIPYMLVVGDREQAEGTVAVRTRERGDEGAVPLADLVSRLRVEVETKAVTCTGS